MSKAAVSSRDCDPAYVTFGSKADISNVARLCPLSAKTGYEQMQRELRYSITSSAAPSRTGGTVSPIDLAVLRFIAVSNLVPACTGRLEGLSPRRMRST